jgi:hypothetical protein
MHARSDREDPPRSPRDQARDAQRKKGRAGRRLTDDMLVDNAGALAVRWRVEAVDVRLSSSSS